MIRKCECLADAFLVKYVSEDIVHFFYFDEFEAFEEFLVYFFEVVFVFLGDEDGCYAGSFGGEDFFFEAADGHDEAGEGEFSCHG